MTTQYDVRITDSLEKVLPASEPRPLARTRLPAWPGETVSFQVAARARASAPPEERLELHLEGAGAQDLRVRRVQLMPVLLAAPLGADENYVTHAAAMLPDALLPLNPEQTPAFRCLGGQWDALWCDWRVPADARAEARELTVCVRTSAGQAVFQEKLTLDIQKNPLPAQRILHTEWFYADCLADYYGVAVWSPEHWRIVENFISAAAGHGVNMLLTPLFTPPLDTAVGMERTTCQLLDIRLENGVYSFDFSRLDRWIALCGKHGIRELEMCHLFTQWGAAAAPKVMARVGGVEKRIFGWDTPAAGGAYTRFLRCLLPRLKAHLAGMGMLEHTWFHISDEPTAQTLESWKAARESVADLLEDCHMLDALSDAAFYRQGLIQTPVAANDGIEPFVREQVPELWTYCCCSQIDRVPNRFIAMPSARNRILGVLLYRYRLQGFLHWGFNFYNASRSRYRVDPWRTTDGDGTLPAGDPFLVYPNADGTACESIRGAVLREAFQDHRLLCMAEDRVGREAVLRLLEHGREGRPITMRHYPTDPCWFLELRERIQAALHGAP